MRPRASLAWVAHGYTGSGLVLGGLAAVFIVGGTAEDLRLALLLLLLAGAVDSTDGWLARRFQTARALPSIDGRRLDDIIDFHTFTSIPLLLIWRSGVLPEELAWVLFVPLLASAYGFSQVDAKTSDGFFLGFPSYWNIVAFYLFFLSPPPWATLTVLLVFSGLTFVPGRYLYPSMGGVLGRWAITLGALWAIVVLAVLLGIPEREALWVVASLAFPCYYLAASGWATFAWARTVSK